MSLAGGGVQGQGRGEVWRLQRFLQARSHPSLSPSWIETQLSPTEMLVGGIAGKIGINQIECIKSYLLNSESGNLIINCSAMKVWCHLYIGGLIHKLCYLSPSITPQSPSRGCPLRQTWVPAGPAGTGPWVLASWNEELSLGEMHTRSELQGLCDSLLGSWASPLQHPCPVPCELVVLLVGGRQCFLH